jgi:hypothetical protein
MTLQECKDQIAYRMRLTWDGVREHHSVRGMETTMGEVAKLYASEQNAELKDLLKELTVFLPSLRTLVDKDFVFPDNCLQLLDKIEYTIYPERTPLKQ